MAGFDKLKNLPPRADAKPGPYITPLNPAESIAFQSWLGASKAPYDPSPQADYDLPGYWKAQIAGDPRAQQSSTNQHFPDTWKTPYHQTFSNESMYALPTAPRWRQNRLIDSTGRVVADESGQKR
jgi:hypothetical protein